MISEKSGKENTVNLFWTGGWDSTFRLMQIIFEEKRKVQPYYIIDLSRSSWEIEIKTMNDIKSLLVSDYPKKSELMEPVMIFNKNDISIDEEVSEAWKSIRNKRHIGNQYIWLASFIKKTGIKNMEMSIVNSDDCESNSPSLIAYLQDERITSAEKASCVALMT